MSRSRKCTGRRGDGGAYRSPEFFVIGEVASVLRGTSTGSHIDGYGGYYNLESPREGHRYAPSFKRQENCRVITVPLRPEDAYVTDLLNRGYVLVWLVSLQAAALDTTGTYCKPGHFYEDPKYVNPGVPADPVDGMYFRRIDLRNVPPNGFGHSDPRLRAPGGPERKSYYQIKVGTLVEVSPAVANTKPVVVATLKAIVLYYADSHGGTCYDRWND